jgi:hypothetical protein
MATKTKQDIAKQAGKSYLAKDFVQFKAELTNYARNYFSEQMNDFSEASLGGMFIELAAYVGDSMTYYLDHQFQELNPITAVETKNIIAHAKNAGVKFSGAAPSSLYVKIYIETPAEVLNDGSYVPASSALPILREGTTVDSNPGIQFTTTQDIDFAEVDINGKMLTQYKVSQTGVSGSPTAFICTREALCVSGNVTSETFACTAMVPFRQLALAKKDISEIISIKDTSGNIYYEVDYLSQDIVFKRSKNLSTDALEVPYSIEIAACPYRFISTVDALSRSTTIQFGTGDADLVDDDIIPDPSVLALPLYGKETLTRFSIDPRNLLKTKTLGISPSNTSLIVTYRFGGGLNHNIAADTVTSVAKVLIDFPGKPTPAAAAGVVNSLDASNSEDARGGANAPSLEDYRTQIFATRNQQSRIVSQDDLLARLYSLPAEFGRVYRAGLRKSARNPLATELFVLSQNRSGQLTIAPDTLKKNLRTYINEYRLISDAIDVLDAIVVNYGIEYAIVVTPESTKSTVNAAVSVAIKAAVARKYFQIDQPIVEADIINVIINTPGVLSLQSLSFYSRNGTVTGRVYSDFVFDLEANKFKGLIIPPSGAIFEVKFPSSDISGMAE